MACSRFDSLPPGVRSVKVNIGEGCLVPSYSPDKAWFERLDNKSGVLHSMR